jgi:hypothetical protein
MDTVGLPEILPRKPGGWTDTGHPMLLPAPSCECIPNAGAMQPVFSAEMIDDGFGSATLKMF